MVIMENYKLAFCFGIMFLFAGCIWLYVYLPNNYDNKIVSIICGGVYVVLGCINLLVAYKQYRKTR